MDAITIALATGAGLGTLALLGVLFGARRHARDLQETMENIEQESRARNRLEATLKARIDTDLKYVQTTLEAEVKQLKEEAEKGRLADEKGQQAAEKALQDLHQKLESQAEAIAAQARQIESQNQELATLRALETTLRELAQRHENTAGQAADLLIRIDRQDQHLEHMENHLSTFRKALDQEVSGFNHRLDELYEYLKGAFQDEMKSTMRRFDRNMATVLGEMKGQLMDGVHRIEQMETLVAGRQELDERLLEGERTTGRLLTHPEPPEAAPSA